MCQHTIKKQACDEWLPSKHDGIQSLQTKEECFPPSKGLCQRTLLAKTQTTESSNTAISMTESIPQLLERELGIQDASALISQI